LLACTARGGTKDPHQKIAERFAPIFRQEIGVGKNKRFDYPTRADFDGDWIATNDWRHAETYPLPAYVYYSILETRTHYFIHYAVFHPRDWKGGLFRTAIVDNCRHIAEVFDPSRAVLDMALSHENDLEGVLIVVLKAPAPHVVFAESLAHSVFTKFATADYIKDHLSLPQRVHLLAVEDGRPVFSVESKGHGIIDPRGRKPRRILVYRFTGTADDPEKRTGNGVGYALLSIHDTFWNLSREEAKSFSSHHRNYSLVSVDFAGIDGATGEKRICRNPIGTSIRGGVGARNFAKLPWGWRSITWRRFLFYSWDHDQPYPGAWFFDPAKIIKKHFGLDRDFSTVYVYHPYVECTPPSEPQ